VSYYLLFREINPKMIFVDSDLPIPNKFGLELFSDEGVLRFRRVSISGFIPLWSESDLKEVIFSNIIRKKFINEFQPVPLEFLRTGVLTMHLPQDIGWGDAKTHAFNSRSKISFGLNRRLNRKQNSSKYD
jgi:hypothetical protein